MKRTKALSRIFRDIDEAGRTASVRKLERDFMKIGKQFQEVEEDLALRERQEMARMSSAGSSMGPDSPIARTSSFDREQALAQQGLVKMMDGGGDIDAAIMEERRAELEQIEKESAVLKDLFVDMKGLVDDQQEGIDEIEANVDVAAEKAETGVKDLKKALDYRISARKKMVCCMLTLVAIIVVVGIIVGLEVAATSGGGSGGDSGTPAVVTNSTAGDSPGRRLLRRS
eukprot:g648.t1